MGYLDAVQQQFEASILNREPLEPCTEDEVHALEQELGFPLPAAYREFLLWMGHGAGRFLRGSDVFYAELEGLRESAIDLLRENDIDINLPNDAFVFFMHQGYMFYFVRMSEDSDPPVYGFCEGQSRTFPDRLYSQFSEFLAAMISDHDRIWRSLAHEDR